MEDFIYSVNATMPVFLVMVLGGILIRTKMINHEFVEVCNRFVFRITLPCMLFLDMWKMDIRSEFSGKFVLFCFAVSGLSVIAAWLLGRFSLKDQSLLAEFAQGSYRGSVAVLGGAFLHNIFPNGEGGAVIGQVIIGCVPLYNTCAVLLLALHHPDRKKGEGSKEGLMKKTAMEVLKNPLIDAIVLGVIASYLGLPRITLVEKTMASVASLTSPLALLAIGAEFSLEKAKHCIKPTLLACLFKLVIQPAVFLPIAVMLGWRDEWLISLLIMLGAATTPSSYVMARNMGHEGVLTASCIAATTLFSAVTVTFWIYLGRVLGLV